ncbi:polymorphic toxin-type HINT domain-containing protein [Actinomadura sp. B10D3]|uniref:polymorphic toxin-type HINT domain-containing protein n=1 Tax=Actinomadura sp. B10D3 TaxID=3153557 RepID=UPI00325F3EF2
MLRRLGDRGEGSLSYLTVILLVASVTAVVSVVTVGDKVAAGIRSGVCRVSQDKDCGKPGGDPQAGGSSSPSPGATSPGAVPAGSETPEEREYREALAALNKANSDAKGVEDEWNNFDLLKEIAKLGLDFIAGDIINCVKNPNFLDCLWAIVGLVPWGKIGKVIKSIPKIAKLIDRFLDLKRRLDKFRKARKDAKDRLDKAVEACKKKKDPNSFTAGTPVLMADGTRKPIEQVRVGDTVWATDPATARSGPRTVTARITGTGTKHLVDLTIDPDATLGGPTTTITATVGHPFWVDGVDDWIHAGELVFGDTLTTSAGGHAMVVDGRRYKRTETVYNLTVDDLHTYYVNAGSQELLVHNCGDLDKHEEPPPGTPRGPHQLGHTIKDHVDLTDDQLRARAADPRNTKGVAGRWTDKATAQRAVDDALANLDAPTQQRIQKWFQDLGKQKPGAKDTLELGPFTYGNGPLGKVAKKGQQNLDDASNRFTIVLKRAQSPKHKPGYYVYTAYPLP